MKLIHALVLSSLSLPGWSEPASIAFGSCLRQWQPQPVWQAINALRPEAFIFLGDNVYSDVGPYGDKRAPERIFEAYRDLAEHGDFANFRLGAGQNGTRIFATWDDHDYGVNDGGGDYPHKLASKKAFQQFFNSGATATDDRPGIYNSDVIELKGLTVQLLMLDTRSLRSPLKTGDRSVCPPTGRLPNTDPDATILGEIQWSWLEKKVKQPADLRLIASSIQVIPSQHCFEKWANFPAERERLFELIRSTGADGVILVSGDRHLAEISLLPPEIVGYPLYEITASGLNSAMGAKAGFPAEENRFRVHEHTEREDNFGSIQIVDQEGEVFLLLQIRDTAGEILQQAGVALMELKRPEK